jgi:hypothetical protein
MVTKVEGRISEPQMRHGVGFAGVDLKLEERDRA